MPRECPRCSARLGWSNPARRYSLERGWFRALSPVLNCRSCDAQLRARMPAVGWLILTAALVIYIILRGTFGPMAESAIAHALPDVPDLWLKILVFPLIFGGGAGLVFGLIIFWSLQ